MIVVTMRHLRASIQVSTLEKSQPQGSRRCWDGPSSFSAQFSRSAEYLYVFLVLFFTLLCTAIFANNYGNRLIKPLRYIIKQLNLYQDKKLDGHLPIHLSSSSEIQQLFQEIIYNWLPLESYLKYRSHVNVLRSKDAPLLVGKSQIFAKNVNYLK